MKNILTMLLLISLNSTSQNLDSLWTIWNDTSRADTSRLEAIDKIVVNGYLYSKPDSAFYFAGLQYDFAESINNKEWMSNSLNMQGVSFAIIDDLAKAIDYYTRSLKIKEEIGDKQGIASSLGNIGLIYDEQGNYNKAISYFTKSLKIFEELGNKSGIAGHLNNIGLIYDIQEDYAKAIDYYNRSLKMDQELGNKSGIATSLNNIGNIYQTKRDLEKAMNYFTKSLNIFEEIGNKSGIAMSLNNIGENYFYQDDYSKAMYYHAKGLMIDEEIGNKKGIERCLNNIGNIYKEQGYYYKALEKYTESLGIALEIGNVETINDASENLWEINKKLGKHKQALEMYELYIKMRDSILSIENKTATIHLGFKYEYEKEQALVDAKHNELMHIKSEKIKTQNEKIEKERVIKYSLFIGMLLVISSLFVIFKNLRKTKLQKALIETQHKKTKLQKALIETQHKDLTSSITYAKRIQAALLPTDLAVTESFKDSFILYLPKDIVAGDFYWLEKTKDTTLFAVADCTGHGVPGAMVSVICNNGLNRSVREYNISQPSKILDKTREIVIQEFAKSNEDIQDGMDIALCSIKGDKLNYSGAHNPLIVIRDKRVIQIKSDRQPIGAYEKAEDFTNHTLDIQKDDLIYIFTVGFTDQFGGEKRKKYRLQNLLTLLTDISTKSLSEQNSILKQEFTSWKGTEDQIDDVCIMGVRV
jgi:serine phosphatase RsbU (regulator of sigma subunit)/TPR repeat protein